MRQPKAKSRTDWDRVKRESDANAPIPYDPEDGPYDPNNDGRPGALERGTIRAPSGAAWSSEGADEGAHYHSAFTRHRGAFPFRGWGLANAHG